MFISLTVWEWLQVDTIVFTQLPVIGNIRFFLTRPWCTVCLKEKYQTWSYLLALFMWHFQSRYDASYPFFYMQSSHAKRYTCTHRSWLCKWQNIKEWISGDYRQIITMPMPSVKIIPCTDLIDNPKVIPPLPLNQFVSGHSWPLKWIMNARRKTKKEKQWCHVT